MALATANEKAVLDGSKICLPRTGAWHAELLLDDQGKPDGEPITGRVRIVIGDDAVTLSGTADTGAARFDMSRVRVVGGAGGLGKLAIPRYYGGGGPRVGTVLKHLLADGGETLSSTSSTSVLNRELESWTTFARPIKHLISKLLASASPDATWRVLPDGKIWVGIDEWADSGLREGDYEIIDMKDDQQTALIGMETPRLQPGTKLADKKVSYVEYCFGENVRIKAWFGDAQKDRMAAAFASAVRAATPALEYASPRVFEILLQSDDLNSVDLTPLSNLVPEMGTVPLVGPPGMRSKIHLPAYAVVVWPSGDPSQKPFALAIADDLGGGADADEIRLAGGGEGVARKGDSTKLTLSTADVAALAAALLTTGAFTPSGSSPGPSANPVLLTGGEITGGSSIVKAGG